jgi:GT2 family glycosyltransferase
MPVVVVDNSGDRDVLEAQLAGRAGLLVTGPGRNIGFGQGANLGAAALSSELLLFVNPDARPRSDDLEALVGRLDADKRLAAVAPALIDSRGAVHNDGGGWFPSFPRAAIQSLLARRAGTHGVWLRPVHQRDYRVEWLSGACLVIRAETFRDVGGFSPEYLLYNEDMDLGYKLTRAGWRLLLDASLRVPHEGGGSAGSPTNRTLWRLRGGALGFYVSQHASSPFIAHATRWVFALGFVLRAGCYAAMLRGTRAKEMLTYAASVLSGRPATLS